MDASDRALGLRIRQQEILAKLGVTAPKLEEATRDEGISRPPEFLSGGGEMGALMRAHNWTQSPLGPPAQWPDSLKMALSICLNSRFPMVIFWGPEFTVLYNDAWRPILGGGASIRRRSAVRASRFGRRFGTSLVCSLTAY